MQYWIGLSAVGSFFFESDNEVLPNFSKKPSVLELGLCIRKVLGLRIVRSLLSAVIDYTEDFVLCEERPSCMDVRDQNCGIAAAGTIVFDAGINVPSYLIGALK